MLSEPIVISALIGLVGVIIGVSGYALQNWFVKRRDIDNREYTLKRERYENFLKIFHQGINQVQNGKKTTPEFRNIMSDATNVLWLYASDEVLTAVHSCLSSSGEKEKFQSLIYAMRKDLTKTKLKKSMIKWFRGKPSE